MSDVWRTKWIKVNDNKLGAMAGTDAIIPEEAAQDTPEELRVGFLRPSVPSGLDVQPKAVLTGLSKATWPIKLLGAAAYAESEPFVPRDIIPIKMWLYH